MGVTPHHRLFLSLHVYSEIILSYSGAAHFSGALADNLFEKKRLEPRLRKDFRPVSGREITHL